MIIAIPGEPVPKGRPKFTKQGRAYTPKKTKDYENLVRHYIRLQGGKPVDYPVAVSIRVYRAIPQSWSNRKKEQAIRGELVPSTRPDLDNYVKALLDASNGLLFNDDNQVIQLIASKHYSKMPYTEIEVERYEPNRKDGLR